MGCGCKQQPQQPVVPKGITPIQIQSVQPEEITYTIEELINFCIEYATKNPEYGSIGNNGNHFANAVWDKFSK
jgi:hypothetical protein